MRIVVVALVVVICITGCTKPKDLEYVDFQNIKVVKWGFPESLIGVDIRMYNPNKQQVRLKDAVAKFYANSTYLGEAHTEDIITVPRKDTFAIPLILKVQTGTALTKVIQTFSDSVVAIKVDGEVKMGKAGVFLSYPIKYEQLQRLSDLDLNF